MPCIIKMLISSSIFSILLLVSIGSIQGTLSAQVEREVDSIFINDTCAPPCWFGLVPGESTATEVEAFFQSEYYSGEQPPAAHGTLDAENQQLVDGLYKFYTVWKDDRYQFVTDDPFPNEPNNPNRLYIQNGKLNRITISFWAHADVNLGETLEALGTPDQIRIFRRSSNQIHLIYEDLRLRVNLILYAHTSCTIDTMRDAYEILQIRYFSPEAAAEMGDYVGFRLPQPALTAFEYGERPISQDTWNEWLIGNVTTRCTSLWLPEWGESFPNDSFPPFNTATAQTLGSLFPEDTCAPPCWFGLVPGESTLSDVARFIRSSGDLFEWRERDFPSLEPIRVSSDGDYLFSWLDFNREGFPGGGINRIILANGILESVDVSPNRVVLLRHVLERLGLPNTIVADATFDERAPAMDMALLYPHLNMVVKVRSDGFGCYFQSIVDDVWVEQVLYHAPTLSRDEIIESLHMRVVQVPPEAWDAWLAGRAAVCDWLENEP